MKRAITLFSIVIVSIAASFAAFGQAVGKSKTDSDARKACPFSIAGLWRSSTSTQTNPPTFFDFSPEGWVMMMSHSPDTLPQDLEMVTTVNYVLDNPAAPKEIRFKADRGNDSFGRGVTVMDIVEYGDDSFTTRNATSGEIIRWVREQTRRYFVTFVARAGAEEIGPAFVTWTTLDGRKTTVDALGVHTVTEAEGKSLPVFGAIPSDVYDRIVEESEEEQKRKKQDTVFMRFELNAKEFEKSHEVFKAWDKLVKDRGLPSNDPYLNAVEFIKKAAGSIEPCGEKNRLQKLDRGVTETAITKHAPSKRPMEYIREFRTKNEKLHMLFPWGWRPVLQIPGQ